MEAMLASSALHVDAAALELASYLFAGRGARLLTAVTAELLPPRLRYAPAYQHASRRLAGKPGPDPIAALIERWAMRLAVGRPA